MTSLQLQAFALKTAETLTNYTVNDFFNAVVQHFLPTMDLEFTTYFVYLITHNEECCVDHSKLVEYGVITDNDSAKIKRKLDSLKCVDGIDYTISTDQVLMPQGGSKSKNTYNLTPRAFKMCLMRSKNTTKYSEYYLLLEQIQYYYNMYQLKYKDILLSGKDIRIDSMMTELKTQSEQIRELLGYGQSAKTELIKVNTQLATTHTELVDVKTKLVGTNERLEEIAEDNADLLMGLHENSMELDSVRNTVVETSTRLIETDFNLRRAHSKIDTINKNFFETSGRSVPHQDEPVQRHEFVLIQSKSEPNKLKAIRGIREYTKEQINKKYADDYYIIRREYNANPVQLFKAFKHGTMAKYKKQCRLISLNKAIKKKKPVHYSVQKVAFKNTEMTLLNDYTVDNVLRDLQEYCNTKFNQFNNPNEHFDMSDINFDDCYSNDSADNNDDDDDTT
jgi:predicted nuclease with TOPRIM domain